MCQRCHRSATWTACGAGLGLALAVRDLRDFKAPVSTEQTGGVRNARAFGFVLARASAGLADGGRPSPCGGLQRAADESDDEFRPAPGGTVAGLPADYELATGETDEADADIADLGQGVPVPWGCAVVSRRRRGVGRSSGCCRT
ncbi:hypothetical protein GCM10010302_32470 [Streptomyces polychromogenes]|uniref:Uncharacterized protein n=1 Tax=Streptomyces polychromogenes TaxID=67342 RepID=A0ABN0VDU0_9ACTN